MAKEIVQVAAKAVIVDKKGRVLLVREPSDGNVGSQDGLYGLPGGRLDDGESYEQALHREVLEETGLKVDILSPVYIGEWHPVIKGINHHIVAIFSVCRAKTTDVKLSNEHDDYKWVLPNEAKEVRFMPPDDEVIKRYSSWSNKDPLE